MHYAVHGHTAAELIYERADAEKLHMGLTTWAAAPVNKPVFVNAIKEKIETAIDTEDMEKELETTGNRNEESIREADGQSKTIRT